MTRFSSVLVPAVLLAHAATAQILLPVPPTPAGNPTTPQKALLGKALFWDEQMSSSRTVACGTCHVFGHGGTDPRATNATHPGPDGLYSTADDIHGSFGVVRQDVAGANVGSATFGVRAQSTGRRAPSVINAAYEFQLFWDGRALDSFRDPVSGVVTLPYYAALESQASGPPTNDVEMSHIGRSWTDIANDIANLTPLAVADQIPANLQAFISGQTYAQLFNAVYGSPGVTPERIIFAIAAYERTLISDQSPFDLYLAGQGSLTAQEQSGFGVFINVCSTCHSDVGSLASPAVNDFRAVGVRPDAEDTGRYGITGNPVDMARFKTPGLRNVALRAPYMHNGGLATLTDVVNFYNRGGDFGSIDVEVQLIAGMLTPTDVTDVVAFLNALTDPRVQNETAPFDRPRLWSEGPHTATVFGYGTAGTGGHVPQMVAAAPAFLGNAKFALGLDGALNGAPHFFVLDFAGSTTPFTFMGQNVYLAMLDPRLFFLGTTQGSAPGQGWSSMVLPIPGDPFLAGLPIYGQWLLGDAGGPSGLSSSNAFTTTLF